MTLKYAILATMLMVAPLLAENPPPSTTPPPQEKAIQQSLTEPGEEKTLALESSYRSQLIYPSNFGTAGIFRVRSAESLPEGALTFGIGGEFYSIDNAPFVGSPGGNANTIAESLFVGYSPLPHLTLAAMRRSSSTTFGTPAQLISSLGDFNFSGMYSFPLTPSIAVAPIGNFLIASNFNDLAPEGNTVSIGFGGALTYSFWPGTGIPLLTHFNVLYHTPQIRGGTLPGLKPEMYFNFSRYNTVVFALAAEYQAGDFIPFVELHDTVHTDSPLGFSNSPSRLSVGSRFMPFANKSLAFLGGFEVGLGRGLTPGVPFTPPWQIIGQISYTVGLSSTERKHYYTTSDVNIVDRKFVIRKNINFKIASAELEPDSTKLLDQIADVIKQNKVKRLLIVGHTDSSHTEDYNLKLSFDRASTVKRYLVTQGITEETLIPQGYGKRKPRASNLSEAGRSLNRRVEFFILE